MTFPYNILTNTVFWLYQADASGFNPIRLSPIEVAIELVLTPFVFDALILCVQKINRDSIFK